MTPFDMDLTKILADFIVHSDLAYIPLEVREIGKRAILDCLGVALAGSKEPISGIIMELLKDMGGQPKASVWGKKLKSSSPLAALANGTFGHALDYDDWNRSMRGHPTVPVLPAALAVGEETKASGKDVLEAYLVGFEVEAKLGRALNPHLFEAGWHTTGVLGVMGASAAAARLLKLSSDRVRAALGIAASQAAGLRQNFGTMTKPLHAGNAAKNGVLAAKLAKQGFTADEMIIEEKYGFANVFTRQGNYDLEKIISALGNPFDILSPGVGFKRYPSCAWSHPGIDAMIELVLENDICPEDVESIACGGSATLPEMLIHSRPRTAMEGKFSMQFCLGIALLERKADLSQFSDERVKDPKVQEIIKKITFYVRPDLQGVESLANKSQTVTVVMKNGRKFEKRVDEAKGDPKNPLTQNDIHAKYRECARVVQSEKEMEKTIELVEKLEELKDVSLLTKVLTSASKLRLEAERSP